VISLNCQFDDLSLPVPLRLAKDKDKDNPEISPIVLELLAALQNSTDHSETSSLTIQNDTFAV
jgi:hypothetical protein